MKLFKKTNKCKECPAICCKYITLEFKIPKNIDDFQKARNLLLHENVEIIIEEDGTWWLKLISNCKKLNNENLCNIYKTRPKPCKEFSITQCPFYTDNESLIEFKTIEDIDKYIEEIFKKGKHQISK